MLRRSLMGAVPFLIAAAGPGTAQQDSAPPLKVAASFSILADLAARVGGDAVLVRSLVPAGTDAHGFQPTPGIARAVAESDVVVLQGLGFDAWLPRLIRSSGFKGRQVVASAGIATRKAADHGHGHGHSHGEADPHLWQDATKAAAMVGNLVRGFAAFRPAEAAGFERRGQALQAELTALDADIAAQFAAIPRERRRVVTTHDAFAYFGARYGIDFMAAQGVSAEAEPSARQIAGLIDQIRKQRITAVFLEGQGSQRAMQRLADEAGVRIGGTVFADSLAPAGEGPGSLAELLRHNAGAFARALAS